MSLEYTTAANAIILTNSQSGLLVAAKVIVGHHLLVLEGIGVAVAFWADSWTVWRVWSSKVFPPTSRVTSWG